MSNYATLIASIQSVITQNGNNEITGTILQQTLLSMINSLGSGYQFVGIATPETNPGTPDQRVFYLASSGTYPNFGPATIPAGNLAVFYYDTSWHYNICEITAKFASGEVVNDVHIVKDLTTGGVDDVANAETVKIIANATMQVVTGLNLLDPSTIKVGKRIKQNGTEANNSTVTSAYCYGCTDYIELTSDGLICNHSLQEHGESLYGLCVYNASKQLIGKKSVSTDGNSLFVSTDSTTYIDKHGEGVTDLVAKYVRFNLYLPSTPYDGITDGYAVYKGDTLPSSFVPYFAPYWAQKKQVIEDGEITTKKIADSAVTIDKMADTMEEFLSKNLCNPEECVIGNGKGISINNGRLINSTLFDGQTGFIPIDERGLYCSNTTNGGASGGNMLYDANKQPLQAALGQSYLRGKYLKYVEGAAYGRFTVLPVENASDIMVNRGNTAVDYEPYVGKKKVISPDILPEMGGSSDVKTYLEGVEVQLPNEIVVTKGDNLQVFYRSCVKCCNIEAFDVTAYCKKISTYYGMPHPRYFQLDTSSSSIAANNSFTLTITVSDNSHRVVASGSTTIRVINAMTSPVSTKNILMLGASTLADGRITREVYRRLCTNTGSGTPFEPTGINLSNIAFVGSGSTGSTYPNVYQEAHSGKGWNWYADQGSDTNIYRFFCPSSVDLSNASEGDIYKQGTLTFELTNDISTQDNVFTAIVTGTGTVVATNGTLTKESGSGPDTIAYDTASAEGGNPFWYGGKLDFQHYANDAANHCNGSIDLIVACLGGNDIAQVAEGFDYCKETYIKPFLDAFHADFPNGKVMIYTPPLMRYNGCATKPSANYWSRVVQFWAYAKGYEDLLSEEYEEGHTYSEFVSITATQYEFDNVNLFGGSDIPVCNRSEVTEKFSSDNLHYGLAGCNTVADTLYHCVNDIL